MRISELIHAIEIPFKVPVSPEKSVDRRVFSYLVFSDTITLIDSGVSGTESVIFNCIGENGREPAETSMLILSHSHPDHVGAAKKIKEVTGCLVLAHQNERLWIEDTERQGRERPVPGFQTLVGGPVKVDRLLADGDELEIGKNLACRVIHTPGHSSGSISLWFADEKILFTGDALPLPDDMPIYDDIGLSLASFRRLQKIEGVETLLSSWEPSIHGTQAIRARIEAGVSWLQRIHNTVLAAAKRNENPDRMELCRQVVTDLGLPPFAANPLVARALASSLTDGKSKELFAS